MKRKKKTKTRIKALRYFSYSLVFIFFSFLIFNLIRREIIKSNSTEVNTIVLRTSCQKGKMQAKSLVKVKYLNSEYNVIVNRTLCNSLSEGDTVKLIYYKDENRFFSKK